jgi:protein-S-isoprenylcysteine O-methyltransferase Ste14
MRNLEHKIPPPVFMLIIGYLMSVVAHFLPANAGFISWRYPLVVIFICIGFIFAMPAFLAFIRAKTTVNPINIEAASTLVTTGVYRYSRNPMYVGLTCLLLAWWAYLSIAWLFIGPVVFIIVINYLQIIPEERVLLLKFGREYEYYQSQVRRWL